MFLFSILLVSSLDNHHTSCSVHVASVEWPRSDASMLLVVHARSGVKKGMLLCALALQAGACPEPSLSALLQAQRDADAIGAPERCEDGDERCEDWAAV